MNDPSASRRQPPVKLSDVARLAGASTATVSRVLNHPDQVSAEKRGRVEAALDQLGYVPHGAARSLASRESRTIGVVVPTLDIAVFAHGVQALQRQLEDAGYTLFIACSDNDLRKETAAVRAFVGRGVDGLILTGNQHERAVLDLLAAKSIPCVTTYAFRPDTALATIGIDNRRVMERLACHLIDLGHRRFGVVVSAVRTNDRAADRLAGVRDALAAAGLPLAPDHVAEVPHSIADGQIGMRSLLDTNPTLTAVMCLSDALAIGAIAECRRRRLRVPHDISVTGFDDLDMSSHIDPPLTTVRSPARELGKRAAELLLSLISGEAVVDRIELGADLILRGSTAAPSDRADSVVETQAPALVDRAGR